MSIQPAFSKIMSVLCIQSQLLHVHIISEPLECDVPAWLVPAVSIT